MDAKKLWRFFARNVSTKTDLPPFDFAGNLAQVARNGKPGELQAIMAHYVDKSSVGPSRMQTFREIQRRLNADSSYGGLPTLHSAIWADDNVEAVRLLLELGADPDLPDPKKGLRPAQVACLRGRTKCMEALLQCGVELNFDASAGADDVIGSSTAGRTPLALATRYKRTEIQKLLEEAEKKGLPSLVELCRDGLWFAARSRARRGKVAKDELLRMVDGKNAVEWAAKNDKSKVGTELQLLAVSSANP